MLYVDSLEDGEKDYAKFHRLKGDYDCYDNIDEVGSVKDLEPFEKALSEKVKYLEARKVADGIGCMEELQKNIERSVGIKGKHR